MYFLRLSNKMFLFVQPKRLKNSSLLQLWHDNLVPICCHKYNLKYISICFLFSNSGESIHCEIILQMIFFRSPIHSRILYRRERYDDFFKDDFWVFVAVGYGCVFDLICRRLSCFAFSQLLWRCHFFYVLSVWLKKRK